MFYTSEGNTYAAVNDECTREPIISIADRIRECYLYTDRIEGLTRSIMFSAYGSIEDPKRIEKGPQCLEEATMMLEERLSEIATNLERIEMKLGGYNV